MLTLESHQKQALFFMLQKEQGCVMGDSHEYMWTKVNGTSIKYVL
jgi:hypothetical protein